MEFPPRPRPDARPIAGRDVLVEPMVDERRFGELFDAFARPGGEELWRFLAYGPFADRGAFLDFAAKTYLGADPFFHAIVPGPGGRAEGVAALMRIEPAHGVVEIGHICLSPALQGTKAASEAFLLLFSRVFDDLGYRRLEWKCDNGNAPSKRAAERLGFAYEGLFRQHMVVKGRNRDTAWFAVLDTEWPRLKAAFEAWLDPANFDAAGRQRRSLGEVRASLPS